MPSDLQLVTGPFINLIFPGAVTAKIRELQSVAQIPETQLIPVM